MFAHQNARIIRVFAKFYPSARKVQVSELMEALVRTAGDKRKGLSWHAELHAESGSTRPLYSVIFANGSRDKRSKRLDAWFADASHEIPDKKVRVTLAGQVHYFAQEFQPVENDREKFSLLFARCFSLWSRVPRS